MEVSNREAEVLSLVGQHLSNAEIAARLYISVRTVESHVSALLRKLAVPDRRALARRAADTRTAEAEPRPALPRPLTSFVGRAGELAELTELLRRHRQVTAVGPGGVGKTRLSVAAAEAALADFADGVWFVDLVATTDPDAVAATVAAALGLGEQPGRDLTESVIAALTNRRALLVLDNCEQIRDGVALFLERLLSRTEAVTALATSRSPLLVPFEHVYPVPPLSLSGSADAVTLFLDRAAAVGFELAEGRQDIAAICGRLDGMALAIELAAARLPGLGLDGLAAGLSDPLRMLAGGSRAAQRHRSVRAALDWSHAMLTAEDQLLLRRVSVFAAPFSAGAAAVVADLAPAVAVDGLARLAEQSLLSVSMVAGRTEYRALETIRQYGAERLEAAAETETVRARHLAWCLTGLDELAETASAPPPRAGSERGAAAELHDRRAPVGPMAAAAVPQDQAAAAVPRSGAAEPGDRADEVEPNAVAGETAWRTSAAEAEPLVGAADSHDQTTAAVPRSGTAAPSGRRDENEPRAAAAEPGQATAGGQRAVAAGTEQPDRTATPAPLAVADSHGRATAAWRARFDAVADDCRAALAWVRDRPDRRVDAYRLARALAETAFHRNLLGESQRHFVRAAELTAGTAEAASMLRCAAAVAGCRMRGDDMYRLHREAAAAARAVGDDHAAATDLAIAATAAFRFWGKFERVRPHAEAVALVEEARALLNEPGTHGSRDPLEDPAPASPDRFAESSDASGFPSRQRAAAAIALAEAGVLANAFGAVQGPSDNDADTTVASAERAVELARLTGDPLAESAALDALTGARSWAGNAFAVDATARRRLDLLAVAPPGPATTHELVDALSTATETGLGVGDLPGARDLARRLAEHPLLAEVGDRAASWLLVADGFAGEVDRVLAGGDRFLEAWRRSGSPARNAFGPGVATVALFHGLRGDEAASRDWESILREVGTSEEHTYGFGAVFDATLLLHRGRPEAAMERTAPEPETVWSCVTWIWLHWYLGLRAEAAVLCGHPSAAGRIAAARRVVEGNPVVAAQLDRAEALLAGDLAGLPGIAEAFAAAGSRYQAARTLLLADPDPDGPGAAAMAAMGLAVLRPYPVAGPVG